MQKRALLLIVWIISDIVLFIGTYTFAYVLRVGWIISTDFPLQPYMITVSLVAPMWVAILMQLGVFRLMRRQATWRNISYIFFACIVGSAVFTLGYYFFYGRFFSRLLLVYAFGLSTIGTIAWHTLFEYVMHTLLRRGTPAYPTLIIGATREAAALINALQQQKSPLTPVAIIDGKGAKITHLHGVPVKGKLNKLEEILHKDGITHLVQCSDLEQSINLLSACRSRNITYILLPSLLGIVEHDERIESLEGRQVTVVRPHRQTWSWFFS